MKPLRLLTLLGLMTSLVSCLSQTVEEPNEDVNTQIDTYINEQLTENSIPGVSLAVMQDGKVVYTKGYGLANLEHDVAAKPETVYQLASVSKQFTAAGVLLLVQDGKINLDASIKTYLPDAPATWQAITPRQLFNHTAGFGNYEDDFDYLSPKTEDEMMAHIYQSDLNTEPGTRFDYSNFSYITLGALISKVSGQPFADFMSQRIFEPLGMDATRAVTERDLVSNRAQGYEFDPETNTVKNQTWVNPTLNIFGDGAFYSTVLDMAKWDAALYGQDILNDASKALLWQPLTLSNGKTWPLVEAYGMGWSVDSVNGHKYVEHSGSWQGFTTHFIRFIDDRLSVILLANSNAADSAGMAREVASLVGPELRQQPIKDNPGITSLASTVVTGLLNGSLDESLFAPEGLPDPEFRASIQEIAATLGALQTLTLTDEPKAPSGYTVHRHLLNFENASLMLELVLNTEQKIAALNFR